MKKIIFPLISLVFILGCNNIQDANISEKNMIGKWELTNRKGEKAFRDLSSIITFYNDNSFISVNTYKKLGKEQQETKKGTYKIDGNKLITSGEDNISNKTFWTFINRDLLEYKTNKQNDPDGFLQGDSFYLKKVSDEPGGDSK